jgi:hypothetical protein
MGASIAGVIARRPEPTNRERIEAASQSDLKRETHLELILTAAACLLVGGTIGYAGAYWRYALKPYLKEHG